ncbi:MAG: twin transmembrane helix small protein [Gammaproteobacteria bacterium]|nr:twin transmembrane helix small protein [Gammaproteobacteria bacterium]
MAMLTILILMALGATAVSLFLGIISMERGGEFDRAHSTRYMAMRVGFQGLTLVLLLIALFFARS